MSKTSQTTSGTPTAGDVVIAVMGVTGVGKSTFINYFSDGEAVVGHSLEACTRGVEIHPSTLRDGTKLYLVDTPGFDDTYRSDTDILKEIANWLSSAYENNVKLAGIVYLQRIEDTRLGGAAMKNLRMFKKLCGDNSLASVVLATTRWRHDEMEEGIRKEKELCTNAKMWKRMIDFGSKVMRQDRDEHSAGEILQYLIQRKKPVTLDIQVELVDNNKTLNETGAGQELHAELEKQKANYEKQLRELREEMSETITKMNADLKAQLQEEKEELERRLREAQEHDRELEVTREEMRQQMAREAQRERDELMEERRQAEREVLTSQFALRELQQENVKQLNELKFAVELQQKKDENEILRQLLKAEEESRCVLM